jgi:hypothetical protein
MKTEITGLYGDLLERISTINGWYAIYKGTQAWQLPEDLDYTPTRKITNLIKKLINFRARFMFGKMPYFDLKPAVPDAKGSTANQDKAAEKEALLEKIFIENRLHSKLLKGRKDCSIGGRVAIKLWAKKDEGLKIIISPAQEFFPVFNLDDADVLEKIIFVYALNDESEKKDQRIKKQIFEMIGGKCYLNEANYDGYGNVVEIFDEDYDTGLDFIPVIIVQNGGLSGEIEGESDVEALWSNQDAYNHLTSDDIDALKFQMFGQDVVTDADEASIQNIKIAPGALIDLQTDPSINDSKQAAISRLESNFTYAQKFADTVNRIKNDLYDTMEVPNVGLEQLKGLMQSGKSMKALYWGLMSACEEDWSEWGTALEKMTEYIFNMVEAYNLYGGREIVRFETALEIHHYYPIPEDEDENKRLDMEEVTAQVRSKKSYMKKWGEYEDEDAELAQIKTEQDLLQDNFTAALIDNAGGNTE